MFLARVKYCHYHYEFVALRVDLKLTAIRQNLHKIGVIGKCMPNVKLGLRL